MRVIELLNKIAKNKKLPKIIKWRSYYFMLNEDTDYVYKNKDNIYMYEIMNMKNLNDEVEIIEEDKKIEKIKMQGFSLFDVADKVNEIIDYINKGE